MITNFSVQPSTESIKEFLHLVTEGNDGDYSPDSLNDSSVLLMTNESGELVGFSLLQLHEFSSKKYVHIAHVWIFKEFRHLGHHDNFIDYVKDLARDMGCDGIKTSAVYKKRGYFNSLLGKFGFRPRAVEYVWEDK